jgi:glycosyltransferase AglD
LASAASRRDTVHDTGDDPEPSPTGRRRWVDALLLGITLVLLVVFARHVDWGTTMSALRRADPRLLALAVSFDLASLVVKGTRWGVLLRAVGARGMAPAIRDTIVGAALNNVVAASGGDAARVAISARRSRVSTADVFAALAVERFTDLAVYAALFGTLALNVALPGPFAKWSVAAVVALAATTVVCALLVSRRVPAHAPEGRRVSQARGAHHPSAFRSARTLVEPLARYSRRLASAMASVAAGRRLAIALALSLIVWAGQWATFHFAARAAALPISGSASLLALLVVNASFLLRLTPGNLGVFQVLYVLAAGAAGLDRNRALAVGLLIQLVQYIPVTFIGLILAPAFARSSWRRGQPRVPASDGARTPLQ